MNNLVIITSFLESKFNIKSMILPSDYVICTDGGYDIAQTYDLTPNLLMGDFDSIESPLPSDINIERFPPEKDYTDLELALKKAMELNADNVTIIGGIGGRLDHTFANIQLLSSYTNNFTSLTLVDGKNKCFVLNDNQSQGITIPQEDGSYISLFSLSAKCTGVTFQGVKYPLDNAELTREFPLGVSNEFVKKEAALSVKDGTLLVIISKK